MEVVAAFVTESKSTKSIAEALQVIKLLSLCSMMKAMFI